MALSIYITISIFVDPRDVSFTPSTPFPLGAHPPCSKTAELARCRSPIFDVDPGGSHFDSSIAPCGLLVPISIVIHGSHHKFVHTHTTVPRERITQAPCGNGWFLRSRLAGPIHPHMSCTIPAITVRSGLHYVLLADARPGWSTPLTWPRSPHLSNADAIRHVANACLIGSGKTVHLAESCISAIQYE